MPAATAAPSCCAPTSCARRRFSAAPAPAWQAVMAPRHADQLTADSTFHRTLWHEVGHYLGVDRTRDGRDLDAALGANGNLLEEMKADLVSLFAGQELRRRGYFTDDSLRSHYASGINRTLQNVRPRRDQPYQTMQLMQFNWFLDKGVLRFDRGDAAARHRLRPLSSRGHGPASRGAGAAGPRRRGGGRRLHHPLEQLGRGAARPDRSQHARPAALPLSPVHLRGARALAGRCNARA